MPKATRPPSSAAARHNPLYVDLTAVPNSATGGIRIRPPRDKRRQSRDDEETVPAAIGRKILQAIDDQSKEIKAEIDEFEKDETGMLSRRSSVASSIGTLKISDDEEAAGIDPRMDDEGYVHGHDWAGVLEDGDRVVDCAAGLEFPDENRPRNLADLILAKLAEKANQPVVSGGSDAPQVRVMSQKVVDVYLRIGEYLAKYKSGKIPKAFKAIPRLVNWEEVLLITNPERWTPHAMAEATKLFASNLNSRMSQRFFNLVLLPAVRDDIAAHKKLNYHYYQALRKAVFKPAAFVKGILIPVADDAESLRESVIVGSVVAKVSIPAEHGAAALMKLADPSRGWATSGTYLLGVLINKKWALPGRAISALVEYFYSFCNPDNQARTNGTDAMPVVWHRCLLNFVQKYKYHLSPPQILRVKETVKCNFHQQISMEIRREIGQATLNTVLFQTQRDETMSTYT